jgi:hypothetical protein
MRVGLQSTQSRVSIQTNEGEEGLMVDYSPLSISGGSIEGVQDETGVSWFY